MSEERGALDVSGGAKKVDRQTMRARSEGARWSDSGEYQLLQPLLSALHCVSLVVAGFLVTDHLLIGRMACPWVVVLCYVATEMVA